MLIKIGSSKEASDVTDLLLECHERIRYFVGLARRLATEADAAQQENADALSRVKHYFSEALPLHVADEEQTVLPRLYGKQPELDKALDAMELEHQKHERYVNDLVQACTAADRESLDRIATKLETEFLTHLQDEETLIVPAIKSLVTAEERQVMLAEVRARRSG